MTCKYFDFERKYPSRAISFHTLFVDFFLQLQCFVFLLVDTIFVFKYSIFGYVYSSLFSLSLYWLTVIVIVIHFLNTNTKRLNKLKRKTKFNRCIF